MIVEELKKSILQKAFQGELSVTEKSDSCSADILQKITKIKEENISKGIYKRTKKSKDFNVEEAKYSIPSSWEWVRFIDLCSLLTCGYASTPQYVNEGMPFLSAKNVKPYQFKPEDYKKISYDLYNQLTTTCKPEKNDILLTRVGAGIGEACIIDKNIDFAIYVSLTLIKLVDYKLINNKYILYWLNSPYGLSTCIRNISGKDSSQGNLNVDNVRNFLVPFPPLEEQQRIVDKIEELFAKLDELKPIEEELELLKKTFPSDMKNSILNEAYTGILTKQDYSTWCTNKLIDCCSEIVTGNSISETIKKSKYTNIESGYNYIATKDLEFNHIFNYKNGVKIPFTENGFKYADVNDILMCIEGGSAGKKIGLLNEKVCYGNKLCKFSTNNNLLPKFLYYYLQSPLFLKNFNSNLSGIIGGVSINKIKTIEIKYPTIEEQQRIVDKLEQLLPLCDEIDNIINI